MRVELRECDHDLMNIPVDLGRAGQVFWESVAAVYDLDSEPAQRRRLLVEAARVGWARRA
jgi:hypothetical protein